MTFTEAAAHVLRLVGKPLHYKEITDVAIERDLLSHVGKSPEVTMGARLAAVVKKDPKDNPLVRVKPGVFALRDWDQAVIDSGLADRTPALERIAKLEVERGGELPVSPAATASLGADGDDADEESSGYPELGNLDADEDEDIGDDERARAELAAAATELFVPEEDDDEPILGGSDPEVEAGDSADRSDASGKRRRRRRRRGGRTGGDEDNGLPSYTVADAPLLADADDEDVAASPRSEGTARSEAGPRSEGGSRSEGRARGESRRFDSGEGRGEGRRDMRNGEARNADFRSGEGGEERGESRSDGRGEPRGEGRHEGRGERAERGERGERGDRGGDRDARADARGGDAGRSLDDLGTPSILALLDSLLGPRSRSGPMPIRQLAEQGLRRMRSKVEITALQDAIGDVVRGEVVRARIERRRPRFVIQARGVSSTDWGLDAEVLKLERELSSLAARHREAFQRSFSERLQALPPRALGDFFSLLLSQMGFEEVQPVRRQGAHNQEMHFSAVARSATGDLPTAIIMRRDGRDLGRERVIDLRGALHHYNGAQAGLLATTGQVMSGAREEARVPNAAPVTLYDGASLAKVAAQQGIGVSFAELRVPMVDVDLLESLTAG